MMIIILDTHCNSEIRLPLGGIHLAVALIMMTRKITCSWLKVESEGFNLLSDFCNGENVSYTEQKHTCNVFYICNLLQIC